MASVAATTATPQPKKARPNPARRKSAKNKEPDVSSLSRRASEPPIPTSSRETAVQQVIVTPNSTPKKGKGPSNTGPTTTPPPGANPGQNSQALALAAPAIVTGGLLGCAAGAAVLMSVGIWHDYAGAESAVLAAKAAKLCLDNLADEVIASLKAGTYSTDEALDILRRTTLAYASTIPGGTPYVERIYREVNLVRKWRGRDIDRILSHSYAELSRAGKRGASADQMRGIVMQQLAKLSTIANKAIRDIADRNPSLKPYKDGAVKALQGSPEPKVPTMNVNISISPKKGNA